MFVSPLHRSKNEVLDTADRNVVDRNVLANDVAPRVPLSRWLKRYEEKTK
jgi:hypothetical protein